MENQIIKKVRGRPPKYSTDEEREEAREWQCLICNNDYNYSLSGRSNHLKTKKHIRNFNELEYRKKDWYCLICNNDHNYSPSGRYNHLKTKKHIRNSNTSTLLKRK